MNCMGSHRFLVNGTTETLCLECSPKVRSADQNVWWFQWCLHDRYWWEVRPFASSCLDEFVREWRSGVLRGSWQVTLPHVTHSVRAQQLLSFLSSAAAGCRGCALPLWALWWACVINIAVLIRVKCPPLQDIKSHYIRIFGFFAICNIFFTRRALSWALLPTLDTDIEIRVEATVSGNFTKKTCIQFAQHECLKKC